jgi:hypothetical protein
MTTAQQSSLPSSEPTPGLIVGAIQSAPAWALLGLTVPSERLREDAARAVAEHVCAALARERDQLALPLG